MLTDNSKKIIDENYLLRKRKDAHDSSIFKGLKNRYFLLGIFFGLVILLVLFFISDYSKVYHISVDGNYYLSDEDVIKIADISEESRYLLVISSLKENSLKKSAYINDAKVEKLDDHIIKITVEENKQVGYISENNLNYILLIDGTKVLINDENVYMTTKIPYVEGYSNEQLETILRGFKSIDADTINEISEIHRYPFSYDENMMEVIMRDGNFCFVSWTGLDMLDKYYSIISGIDSSLGNVCIYLDELTNSGYVSVCPWQENANSSDNLGATN